MVLPKDPVTPKPKPTVTSTTTNAGGSDFASALMAMASSVLNNVPAGDTPVTVPGWVTGTSGYTTGDINEYLAIPFQWAQQGASGKAKLSRLSKLLFGKDADLNDIAVGWSNALKYSNLSNTGVDSVAANKDFKPFVYNNTSFEIKTAAGPQNYTVITGQEDAKVALAKFMLPYLGKNATKNDFNDFYKKLVAAQKKNPQVTKQTANGQIITTGGVSAEEFARNYVLNKIAGNNPDLKGQLGAIQDSIAAMASNNGIALSNADVVKIVKDIANGADINSFKTQFNEQAQKKYTALAEQLKANPDATVMDLATDKIRTMASMLEIDPSTITLRDVEPAISAVAQDGKQRVLADWEWQKQLRKDARYQYTSRAKSEATNTALSFARAFGANI